MLSEHRLYYLRELADSFVYMRQERIVKKYTAEEFRRLTEEERSQMGLRSLLLDEKTNRSADVKNAGTGIDPHCKKEIIESDAENWAQSMLETEGSKKKYFHLQDFTFAYKHQPPTLKIKEAHIPAQGITAIVGRNGAGKSTFSRALCGLLKKCGRLKTPQGEILTAKDRLKTCYMVMQDVNHQLFTESVLEGFKTKILILDEPTSGLDLKHMQETASVLKELAAQNIAIYVVTHDPEFMTACCTNVIEIEDGEIKQVSMN